MSESLCKTCLHKNKCDPCDTELFKITDCNKYEQLIQTNADRIRNMTDEELAKWIFTPLDELGIPCLNTICYGEEYDCVKCVVNWLKQECEE